MIQVQNLTKRIGSFSLRNISFELPEGYIMGLIGENGSGKTTLIRLLLGLYRENEGQIAVDGMHYEAERKQISSQMGFVLGDPLFKDTFSLERNGKVFGAYYETFQFAKLQSYLEEFGLNGREKYGRLSKGEQLKFQMAFALAHQPKYLILDEPVGNFEPEFRNRFYGILTQYVSDGKHSVILSSHLTDEIERITDYVVFLKAGQLVFFRTLEEMREHYRVVSGEAYKIKGLPKEDILFIEEGTYGAKALIRYHSARQYDSELLLEQPTMGQMMYFWKKGDLPCEER